MSGELTIPGLDERSRTFVDRVHQLMIDGAGVDAADGRTFAVLNPSTSRKFCRAALAGPVDVDLAVAAAQRALDGPWRSMPAAERARIISRLADLIELNGEELAQIEALDSGKPVTYARTVDVASTVDWFRYYAGWPTKINGESATVGTDSLYYSAKEPVGVCGLIIPWNYPLLMAAWKVAPALAAGCTMILKPAEQTPLTALRLGELATEAGIPDGVLNVLTGDGTTGSAIVDHPGVTKISFTGSTNIGRQIGAKAGRDLKRVTLELGGKSASIILADADLENAIAGSFSGIYFNTGQSCTAGSRLYVPSALFDQVIAGIADLASATTPLPGLDPESTLGPVISRAQYDRVNGYIETGLAGGAELVAGGRGVDAEAGWFIPPTLFVNTNDDSVIAREEIFGPVLVASPYDELDEVVRRANDSDYGLAAGLWTRDLGSAHKLASRLDAGTVYINRWSQYGPNAPFGGYKSSGLGYEHGQIGLDSYLKQKSILIALG